VAAAARAVVAGQLPEPSTTVIGGSTEHEPTAEDYVRAVQAEQRDDVWATATSGQFEQDLRDKGERLGFRVRSVDCRSARCYAELDYESLRVARAGFKEVLGSPNRVGCPLRLLYPTDGLESAPLMGVMIVDCRGRQGRPQNTTYQGEE
jgi:hypothetical protein